MLPPASEIELPQFTPGVVMKLQQNDLSSGTLNDMLKQAANYYYYKYPTMKDSVYYQAIGLKLVKKYKCLIHEGSKPWARL